MNLHDDYLIRMNIVDSLFHASYNTKRNNNDYEKEQNKNGEKNEMKEFEIIDTLDGVNAALNCYVAVCGSLRQ